METTAEVQLGRETLEALMSRAYGHINYAFIDDIDAETLGLKDYRSIVTEPMSLKRMSDKFNSNFYRNIREFVCDFRLMLLNCYRYNGTNSRMGRLAEKMELLFEQKLQLLSPEIRNSTSIQSTLGSGTSEDELINCGLSRRRNCSRLFLSGDSRQLTPVRAIMEELEHAPQPGGAGVAASLVSSGMELNSSFGSNQLTTTLGPEERISLLIFRLSLWQRKRKEEALIEGWNTWWSRNNGQQMLDIIHQTPEFLESYLFMWISDPFLAISDCLALRTQTLNLSNPNANHNLCLYDLEVGLATSIRSSQTWAICMNCLLATPKERTQIGNVLGRKDELTNADADAHSRQRLHHYTKLWADIVQILPMDYDSWQVRLSTRVESWYRMFWDKGKSDVEWAMRRLGISPQFFAVCGLHSNPMMNKRFHELSIYQQILIFYALCESTMRSFDALRLSIDRSSDWDHTRPVYLGTDHFLKQSYIHFPTLLGTENATQLRIYRISYETFSADECCDEYNLKTIDNLISESLVESDKTDDCSFVECPTLDLSECSSNVRRSYRGRKSKSAQTNQKANTLDKDFDQHNAQLIEKGLTIPSSVQRLPTWLDPCLARYTLRRWFKIAQNLLDDVNAKTVKNLDKRQKRLFGQLSTCASTFVKQFEVQWNVDSGQTKSKGGGRGGAKKRKFSCILDLLESRDNEIVSDLLQNEPILHPSIYGTLAGSSRSFLSVQLSRNYGGSCRVANKAKSCTSSDVNSETADQEEDDEDDDDELDDEREDEDNDNPSLLADDSRLTTNIRDSRALSPLYELPRTNLCAQPGDLNSDARKLDVNDDDDDDDNHNNHNNEHYSKIVDELTLKQDTFDKLVTETKFESLTEDCHELGTEVDKADLSPIQAVIEPATGGDNKPDQTEVCDCGSDLEKKNEDIPNNEEISETLLTQPDESKFKLVVSNLKQLQELLTNLRQSPLDNQDKSHVEVDDTKQLTSQPDCDDGDDDCDAAGGSASDVGCNDSNSLASKKKKRRLNDGSTKLKKKSEKSSISNKKAVQYMESLIHNLETLHTELMDMESYCIDAQQMSRLRLLKEVEIYEAIEAKKNLALQTVKRESDIFVSIMPAQTSVDLSNDRAGRHMRREQRQIESMLPSHHGDSLIDDTAVINDDDDEDDEDEGDDDDNDEDYIIGRKQKKLLLCDKSKLHPPSKASTFAIRVDVTGKPKLPISRFHLPILNAPKIRRSALLEPSTKTVSILPKPCLTQVSKISRLVNPTPIAVGGDKRHILTVQPSKARVWTNGMLTASPRTGSPASKKIYRVYDTLFTEDVRPVKIGPDGKLVFLDPDMIGADHKRLAVQMIARYHQQSKLKDGAQSSSNSVVATGTSSAGESVVNQLSE